jgi:hypothetical protein
MALSRNLRVRLTFASLGFALIYMIWVVRPVMEPSQYGFYHWSGPARNFFVPALLNLLAVWLLVLLLLLLARKPGRTRVAIWTGLVLFTPCVAIKLNVFYHRFDSETLAIAAAALFTILLTAAWRPSFAERFERILAPITTVLIFLGLFGAFVLCQFAWYGWRASLVAESSRSHHQQALAPIEPHRIIWIVFDELSQQQTYEHRYPGLELPAFDALAAHATVFTNAQPFDIYTEAVIPGLLAGKPFDKILTSSSLEPRLRSKATGQWQTFQQHDTIFQDALNAGYSTAVAGWYNPYCRIAPAVLDSCYWIYHYPFQMMEPSSSILANALMPIRQLLWTVLSTTPAPMRTYFVDHPQPPASTHLINQGRIDDYQQLIAASDTLLRDRSYSFVLLHLPVPHPWGVYDRRTGKFTTTSSSYNDNLALADKCLAGLRQTLEQTGQWDSSTVVVMGDHSWRTKQIWKPSNVWTQEDELASAGGQYDPRPAYLVKLPNQTTAAHIDTAFPTVDTRKLFDALLGHQINTPADLATWAHSTPSPSVP